MTDHLVVARLRPRTPNEAPRFTRMGTTEELLTELQAMLPADTAYVVVPDPDGKGFSFREAFRIQLTVTPSVGQFWDAPRGAVLVTPEPLTPPASPMDFAGVTDMMRGESPQDATGRDAGPTPTLPMAEPVKFNSAGFERPRSQAELLAERGITEPKVNLRPVKKVVPTPVRAAKGRKKYPAQDPNDKDDPSIPDDKLPSTRSLTPRRSVTKIRQATPAEAAAASHFNS
jgi:hypothetical protein